MPSCLRVGITPAFVRKLVDAGYDDLTVEELVKIKIHGMDGMMARRNVS
jgi:hypothetical protein